MRGLYKFYWDCGRSGHLEGVFTADAIEVADAIGKSVYFGEVLGKHSEIYGDLDAEDITLISTEPAVIAVFDEHLGGRVGFNPLRYFSDDDEDLDGDSEDDDTDEEDDE